MFSALLSPVGHGDFTSEEDRNALVEVLEKAVERKLHALSMEGAKGRFSYNVLQSFQRSLLSGMTTVEPQTSKIDTDCSAFLTKYGYLSWRNVGWCGTGPLFFAVLEDNIAAIGAAAAKGADINACSRNPDMPIPYPTPLTLAAFVSKPETIKCLLDLRASVNSNVRYGMTALHYSTGNSNVQVELLIQAKASVNARTALGITPLLLALSTDKVREMPGIVRTLLDARADITHRSYMGSGVGAYAAIGNASNEVVQILLDAHADINQSTATPQKLGKVVKLVCKATVKLGDRSESKLFLANSDGNTWLHMASYFGRHSMAKYLAEASADMSLTNHGGLTAVDLAKQRGFSNIASMLEMLKDGE